MSAAGGEGLHIEAPGQDTVSVNAMAVGTDAEVLAASGMDPAGFATLCDRYAAQLYGCAYQRVGEQTAQDVVADTFLAAFQRRASYDPNRADVRP